jgi:hypothetical protein
VVGSETGQLIRSICSRGETGLAARTDQRRRSKTEPAAVQDDAGEQSGGENRFIDGLAGYSRRSSTSYSTGCATSGVAGMVDRPASSGDPSGGLVWAMYDYPHPT